MGIIGWIVLGLIVGAIAKLIMPGKDPGGILVTLLLGVVGAFVGGLIGNWIFGIGIERFWSLSTWLLAIVGSVIVLGIYRVIAARRRAVRGG
ncbi:GlsB/YeaQ/YmgE family stress response membrane protein [Saccharopolyspora sp. K220]|uniref:GlsB/YeaQ/YmgE family stress response membrane protein n=1 Tax=Saccharopolyspora soli TaxID=2926618 RepID=UPI001F57675F|nr:GlsB/YeaQ/YmgE family stress response membrane protein [Saccharopolyspora soli]MCI2419172.1 GlsB/YeaQ/YmgE family stress response membrane protein [Saccharopolyspora soli]